MPAQPGYYAQSQKRWSDASNLNTAVIMAGQLTPGRIMPDLCVATLTTLYPNTQPGSERVSSLRAFIQAVLDAAAVSADVVLLALYYLRKTSSNDNKEPSLMSKVVDANGTSVDGSDSMVSLQYLSGEGNNSPATQLRVRFVAALTCAHKFDADAAYTTRTWADLGGLNPAAVVRAERELLAQLEFQLNVSRDTLYSFREEINQWMLASAVDTQSSYVATAYEKPLSMPQPAFATYTTCQRLQGAAGMMMGRCSCISCTSYANAAGAGSETISPATSPSNLHAMWSTTAAATTAAAHHNGYNGYDMSWPTTPTNNAFTIAATDDYFAASRYAYAHTSAAMQSNTAGNNGTYYSMPQLYQSQEASPVTYAASTAMMMPEPQVPVWPAVNGCYSSHGGAAMVEYNSCFDTTFAVNAAAVSMMPQPVAFYAY
jgi:hypothetical protein